MSHFSIAIDGPAGAGKSTVAKLLADKLKVAYVDTGSMYRAFTLKLIDNNIDLKDLKRVIEVLEETSIDFKDSHIYLDGKIVDTEIRDNNISNNVSEVAKIREVRDILVEIQRDIARRKSTVMDGRDIGSNVLKDAKYKFYLTASVEERASRRYKELKLKDDSVSLDSIKNEIQRRDEIDSTREVSPLVMSDDAIEIDSTYENVEETVNRILNLVKMVD